MVTHTPNCPGGTCDDPETTFICDVCGRECAACCGVAESNTCDKCFEEGMVAVCPGCHAVAPERCLPGCIDAEMAREREASELDVDDRGDDDDDWQEGPCSECRAAPGERCAQWCIDTKLAAYSDDLDHSANDL